MKGGLDRQIQTKGRSKGFGGLKDFKEVLNRRSRRHTMGRSYRQEVQKTHPRDGPEDRTHKRLVLTVRSHKEEV